MRQMMGTSPSFWEWQWDIVWCPVCKVQLATGLLAYHHHAYHRTESTPQWATLPAKMDPRLYMVYLPVADGSIRCPVGRYEGRVTTCTNLQTHLIKYHEWDTLVIME